MAVLTINQAMFPTISLSKQSGGSLNAGTYYYRVAAVNTKGECCAGPSNSIELTSGDIGGGIRIIRLTFTFPSWASSVKIYRNTSDAWDAGDLFLESATSSPYDDDGDLAPSVGVPVSFEADVEWPSSLTGPINIDEPSCFIENMPPGREGGIVQYLGSPSNKLVLTGELKGSTSKTDLDKLRTFRSHGNPLNILVAAYTLTWIDNDYFIARVSWSPRVGKNPDVGAAQVVYVLELVQYTP